MKKNLSSYILFILITVLVISLYLGDFSGLRKLQWKIDDIMYSFRGEETSAPEIVLVNIDDASLRKFGDWPWSYATLADLVATCNSGKPKTILMNLDLASRVSEDTSGHTQILANQVSWVNNLILSYDIALSEYSSKRMTKPEHLFNSSIKAGSDLGILEEETALNIRKPFLPSGIISQYADGLGFVFTEYDSDRRVRRLPLVANFDGYIYPSAPLLAAARHLGYKPGDITVSSGKSITFGQHSVPIDNSGRMFINFNSPQSTFTEYSAAEILREQIDLSRLKDGLVIIGLTAEGVSEFYNTPVSPKMMQPELLANVIENITHEDYITRLDMSAGLNILILLGFGAFCAATLPRVTLLYRMVILIFWVFILANLNFILFNSYSLLTRSLYFVLEIILFMIASPLLEEFKFGGKFGMGEMSIPEPSPAAPPAPKVKTRVIKQEPDIRPRSAEISAAEEYQDTNILQPEPDTPRSDTLEETMAQDYSGEPNVIKTEEEAPHIEPPKEIPPPRVISPAEPASADIPIPPVDSSAVTPVGLQSPASGASGPLSDSDQITHLGRYQIVEVLGKGAMGTVFKGIDPAINRDVALKTIRLDFVSDQKEMAELRDRLFREAQAAGNLSHPNIVTIYDVGSEGSLQYIAMECLQGQTLEDMIKKRVQFSYKIIARIISQICSALQYAHENGIVHRDIKPANIMVLPDYTVKVMDFGIARIDTSSMTKTGIAMGTPNYIAPELLQGQKVDRRCDIYSLGVVIYELLTGQRPFRGENLTSLIYSIVNEDPKPPSQINSSVPLIFDHLTAKALHKNPKERFQKATDISSALSDFVGSFGSASKVGL